MLFSIISIVFLAGCARGGGEGPSGQGVVITNFDTDFPIATAGTDVTFTLEVQNMAQKEATNVKVEFFGLSSEWTEAAAVFGSSVKLLSSLGGFDPVLGTQGEADAAVVTVKSPAPATVRLSDINYEMNGRVAYKSTSDAQAIVRVVKSIVLKTNPDAQKGLLSFTSSKGPLNIDVKARTPVISDTVKTVRVQFEITNVGGGRTFSDTDKLGGTSKISEITNFDRLVLATIKTGQDLKSCAGVDDGGADDKDTGDNSIKLESGNLRLVGGKSKVISCDIAITATGNIVDIQLDVTLEYGYFVDGSLFVTVEKGFS